MTQTDKELGKKIREYLVSQYGVTGATLDYVLCPDIEFKSEAEDPAEGYETVDQKMTAREPHMGRSSMNDRHKVWDTMSNICGKNVKLLPLPQPPVRACTDARTNPIAQRANQLRSVLARVYAVSIQNQVTNTVL
jgi:hypothetical protein